MLAFGIKDVFEELAVITNVFRAPSVSVTVILTGPFDVPAHAVVIFDGVEMVGCAFTVDCKTGVVVVVFVFPSNEHTPKTPPVCGSTNSRV